MRALLDGRATWPEVTKRLDFTHGLPVLILVTDGTPDANAAGSPVIRGEETDSPVEGNR